MFKYFLKQKCQTNKNDFKVKHVSSRADWKIFCFYFLVIIKIQIHMSLLYLVRYFIKNELILLLSLKLKIFVVLNVQFFFNKRKKKDTAQVSSHLMIKYFFKDKCQTNKTN